MLIAKYRRPYIETINFLPYSPFVFRSDVTFVGYSQPSIYSAVDFDFTSPDLPSEEIDISQVFIDSLAYTSVASIPACVALEQSFFFDFGAQQLYVHAKHDSWIVSSEFSLQQTIGYSTDGVFYDERDVEYLPLIVGGLTITEEADRLVYDKMAFNKNSIALDNGSAEFDQYIQNPVPGSDVNILYISTEDVLREKTALLPVYSGYIDSDEFSISEYVTSLSDKREQLDTSVPVGFFTAADFPLATDKTIGKPIPEGYGDIKGAPAFCTNGSVLTGNVTYKYASDGTSLSQAYVKIDGEWTPVAVASSDPASGTFELSATNGRTSQGRPRAAKVDARLRDISAPGEIMKDMILRYLGRPFTSDFFDISQWNEEASGLADVYLHMGERKKLFEYLEELQNASNYGFRFFVKPSGVFSLKKDDITRPALETIFSFDNVSEERESSRDFTQYATTVRVNYNKDISDDNSEFTIDDTYKEETFDEYRVENDVVYDSNLTSLSDAEDKAGRIALDFSKARAVVSGEVDGIQVFELFDVITLDTRIIDENNVVQREYFGIINIKVSAVVYDFALERTTIRGYDVTDVNPAVLSKYDQGFAAGEHAAGDYAAGPSTIGV